MDVVIFVVRYLSQDEFGMVYKYKAFEDPVDAEEFTRVHNGDPVRTVPLVRSQY